MDAGTVIMGVVAIATFVLPFLWLSNVRKKAEKKILTSLTDFAAGHNSNISRSEILGDMAIGLDEQSNRLFFYKKSGDAAVKQHVELAAIKNCEVIKTSRPFSDNDGMHKVIEKLDLSFSPAAGNQPAIVLEFYDANKTIQLTGELQLVERWAKWVDERLKKTK